LKDYCNYGLEHWGSDQNGVENTRYFLLEWLSFFCRYVPVGLLDHYPVKINDRISDLCGRDNLEIMLAQNKIEDWINISEMLLGPVRDKDRFSHFHPKHEASTWTSGAERINVDSQCSLKHIPS